MTMTDEEMMALLVRVDERTERTEADVATLKHVLLEGNGEPALTVTVARLGERMTAAEQTGREKTGLGVARLGLYGTIGAGAIAGLVELVHYLV